MNIHSYSVQDTDKYITILADHLIEYDNLVLSKTPNGKNYITLKRLL